MNILIKFPSRERPDVFKTALTKYIDLASNLTSIHFLFSLDENDPTLPEYKTIIGSLLKQDQYTLYVGTSNSKIHAVNRDLNVFVAEEKHKFDIILLASDDMWPVLPGYDSEIRFSMDEDTDSYLWFSDGQQDAINTLTIIGLKYYKRFNYLYHPDYKSFFCDNEQTEVAILLNKCKKINKCIISHEHPSWGKGVKMDQLYKKNDSHWNYDKNLYYERQAYAYNYQEAQRNI